MPAPVIHGLEVGQGGEGSFAFGVLRLVAPVGRGQLLQIVQRVGAVVADVDAFVSSIPDELEEPVRLVALPWSVPEDDAAVETQRVAVEGVAGIEAAWFFSCATILSGGDDEGEDEQQASWSNGEPPQVESLRFPIDGYPDIVDELDWEDFGAAFKLAGPHVPGEAGVLRAFHALWLAPYSGRYRNAAVTIDPKRHAAHLWVDRFAVMTPNAEQVNHLMWVLEQLDTVLRVVHARFGGASMAQKYAGMMDDAPEPFVLGGNPLVAAWRVGGNAAVDAFVATLGDWGEREMAAMLRELAIELVTGGDEEDDEEAEEEAEQDVDGDASDHDADAVAVDDADQDQDDDEEDEVEEVDAVFEDSEPMAADAAIAALAVDVLVARAKRVALVKSSSQLLQALVDTAPADDQRVAIAQRVLGTKIEAQDDEDDDDEEELDELELDDAFDEDDDDDDEDDDDEDDDEAEMN